MNDTSPDCTDALVNSTTCQLTTRAPAAPATSRLVEDVILAFRKWAAANVVPAWL